MLRKHRNVKMDVERTINSSIILNRIYELKKLLYEETKEIVL